MCASLQWPNVAPPRTDPDRSRSLTALTANLVLPGAGSILLGLRAGWLQAALALAGMAHSLNWLTRVAGPWIRTGERPLLGPLDFLEGLAGPVLFALAWAWSALTAVRVLRRLPPAE
jgi:hypothetical protein